jgi:HSP20 family protein
MEFSLFPRDLFAEVADRLQREARQPFEFSPSIRGFARGSFPPLNVAGTADSVEVYAFAPGLAPESIHVQIEKGVLSISGERAGDLPPEDDARWSVHLRERFSGRFHRVLTLPDDVDPEEVAARYRDGVLQVSLKRKQAARPRRITVN